MRRRDFLVQSTIAAVGSAGCNGKESMKAQSDINRIPNYTPTGAKLITDSTPVADVFYYPAEWEKHE